MTCKYCGSTDLIRHIKSIHIGVYCAKCYRWVKWIPQNSFCTFPWATEDQKTKI